ncbi:tape measure protein [Cohnella thailandensis]|uniref:Tape measure protein n=1 Tax=Cohnella thailandensis TaxID=557557 RepID=A0A841ST07_9BACL|nr:tape measure protein [Cohnella thailandensis]MBB6632757.1 tape measure protein [Cohnella thailandensis]MBP1975554.1 tape measure domain-containing protein [Cohnella thailandensis]
MTTVSSTLKLFDSMTRPMKSITQGMNIMINTMRQLESVTSQNVNVDKALLAAQQRIAQAEAEINRQIDQSKNSQDRFNQSIRQGESAFKSMGFSIIALNQGLELARKGWDFISQGMGLADEVLGANTRLSLINDGLRTQAQLQQQVLDTANETRASYLATSDLVSKLGMFTEGVFKDNDQMLAFAERFNKLLVAGGANTVSREIAILQMSQALGSGRLQGDELRSISEAAPLLLKTLSEGMGVARGQLKQLGADGKLTADVIVKAFEKQSGEIDKMFNQMPMTFGGAMTVLKNSLLTWVGTLNQADGPLRNITAQVEKLTAYIQSDSGQNLLNGLASGISTAVSWLVYMATLIAQIYDFMSNNWPTIEPIVWGIVAAFTAWLVATKLAAGGQFLASVWTGILTAAIFAQTLVTQGLTAAWRGLNAAQKANIFIFLVTLIVGLIVWLVKLWQTNDQFAAALIRGWNNILNFFDQIPIFFQIVGNGIVNGFQWAKVESLKLMEGLVNGSIDRINKLINKLNKIKGVHLDTIDDVEFSASAAAEAEAIKQAGKEEVKEMKKEAAENAAKREQKVLDMLSSREEKRKKDEDKLKETLAAPYSGVSMFSPGEGANNINKVNEVGKINSTVDISSEDLKMMRELAEMKNIQNFVTLQPNFSFGDTHVRQDGRSVDEIIANIGERLNETIASSAQGVYVL